jgi:site-specific DNA recombinase
MAYKAPCKNSKGGNVRKLIQSKRVFAVLARVSTADQGGKGHSLEYQIAEGRKYAARIGATDVLVYEGVESGTSENRQILDRLLIDGENGKFHGVIVQEILRLARHPVVMFSAMDRLRKAGVELHEFDGPVSLDTAEDEFRVMLKSVMGRWTARQGVEKSIALRLRLMEMGTPAAGRPPYGRRWNKDKKKYELIPEKVEQLIAARDLILRKGKSHNETADLLEIGRSSLRKAIDQASLVTVTQRLMGREFHFKCDAILSPGDQRRIEAHIAKNATVRTKTSAQHLLQGLCRCAACGASMTGQTSIKDGKSYSVYRHPPPPPGTKLPPGCVWQIPAALLEEDVLWACARIIQDGQALRQAIQNAIAGSNSTIAELDQTIEQLKKDIRQINTRYERILDRLVAFDEGCETRKRLEDRAKSESVKLSGSQAELNQLLNQRSLVMPRDGSAEEIASKLRSLYWHGIGPSRMMSFELRREFVRTIVGRTSRKDSKGIFISMSRLKGGTKKDVIWRYRIDGDLALAENRIARQINPPPEIREIKAHTGDQVRSLASLANKTVGIKLPPRYDYMQSAKKCSLPAQSHVTGASSDYMQSAKKWTSDD